MFYRRFLAAATVSLGLLAGLRSAGAQPVARSLPVPSSWIQPELGNRGALSGDVPMLLGPVDLGPESTTFPFPFRAGRLENYEPRCTGLLGVWDNQVDEAYLVKVDVRAFSRVGIVASVRDEPILRVLPNQVPNPSPREAPNQAEERRLRGDLRSPEPLPEPVSVEGQSDGGATDTPQFWVQICTIWDDRVIVVLVPDAPFGPGRDPPSAPPLVEAMGPADRQRRRYAVLSADEDARYRRDLYAHLAPFERAGLVQVWHEDQMQAGEDLSAVVERILSTADVVLLIVSKHLFESTWDRPDVRRARLLAEQGALKLIPVLVHPCAWDVTSLGQLQPLPQSGKPITLWTHREQAWLSVVDALRPPVPIDRGA